METSSHDTSTENEAERIKEIVSSLPQDYSWKLPICLYQGHWFFHMFAQGTIFAQQNFKARANDVFLCSFPKSGSTWLRALCFATLNRTHLDINSEDYPLFKKPPHECVPFLENDFVMFPAKQLDVHLWLTHISYPSLPESIIRSACKIVYIWRDQKDAFVSLFHFIKRLGIDACSDMCIEEAFEAYCQGICPFGPSWDHALGYWKASLENPDRVLFLKYEEMMEDTSSHLKRVAQFMGCPFSLEEENEGELKRIVEFCSFNKLSNLQVNKTGKREDEKSRIRNDVFFRKAEVGDWTNYLTSDMAERLDKITENKFAGSGFQ